MLLLTAPTVSADMTDSTEPDLYRDISRLCGDAQIYVSFTLSQNIPHQMSRCSRKVTHLRGKEENQIKK